LKFLNLSFKKLVLFIAFMLLLSVIALSEGIGYNANEITVETEHVVPRVHDLFGPGPETGVGGINYTCTVNVTLNPLLYPLSYLFGNGQISHTFTVFDGPILYAGKRYEVISSTKFGAVFPEMCRNLLYYLIVATVVIFSTEKLLKLQNHRAFLQNGY